MNRHWSSRIFLASTGAAMLWANLDAFNIFTMRMKDGKLLWITKLPKHAKRDQWVYY